MTVVALILLGLIAGAASGLLGIGGALILIPALVYLLGFNQHMAQGTTLALMVPPIGFLAAWTYYKQGYVDIKVAGIICLGFVVGSFIGAQWATAIPRGILRKMFGFLLLMISLHMILVK